MTPFRLEKMAGRVFPIGRLHFLFQGLQDGEEKPSPPWCYMRRPAVITKGKQYRATDTGWVTFPFTHAYAKRNKRSTCTHTYAHTHTHTRIFSSSLHLFPCFRSLQLLLQIVGVIKKTGKTPSLSPTRGRGEGGGEYHDAATSYDFCFFPLTPHPINVIISRVGRDKNAREERKGDGMKKKNKKKLHVM